MSFELGINHQSPLIYWAWSVTMVGTAGNQSPIPFDILDRLSSKNIESWESITNPL